MTGPSVARLEARVRSITWEAEGVLAFELVPWHSDHGFPAFTAGAHVDVQLENGWARSYSLTNAPGETHRYCIAVNRDTAGRGGSRYVHDTFRAGQRVGLGLPRNQFALDERATRSRLIAGGIGVTPLLCMVRRLVNLRRAWTLHHACRSRAHAPFFEELRALEWASGGLGRFEAHFDDERGHVLDVGAIVGQLQADEQVYCCGPQPMLAAFKAATAGMPGERVHLESFSAAEPPVTAGGTYIVTLARSGKTITVAPGQTLLAAVQAAGVAALYSCGQGICGTCEVRVLEGTPEHRDMVLGAVDRAACDRMMICCSGSLTPSLVLDL